MTSISSLSSSSALQALQAVQQQRAQQSQRSGAPGYVDTAATALGMSSSDVLSALQGGSSLDDLATSQGVSHDDLVKALVAGAPKHGSQTVDGTAFAEQLAAVSGVAGPPQGGPGGTGGPGGPPPGPPPSGSTGVLGGTLTDSQSDMLDSLSKLLGTDSDSLLSKLQNGSDLSSMLSDAGVSNQDLASVVQGSLLIDTSA